MLFLLYKFEGSADLPNCPVLRMNLLWLSLFSCIYMFLLFYYAAPNIQAMKRWVTYDILKIMSEIMVRVVKWSHYFDIFEYSLRGSRIEEDDETSWVRQCTSVIGVEFFMSSFKRWNFKRIKFIPITIENQTAAVHTWEGVWLGVMQISQFGNIGISFLGTLNMSLQIAD